MTVGEVQSLERIREILASTRTIAVLGASTKPERPAHYVPAYLHAHGYRIIPVNPLHARASAIGWGEPYRSKLTELSEPIDLVDVFRHPGFLPQHLPEFLAMRPPPRVVWFQQGIRHDEVAAELIAAGIEVVQDRCTLADHRGL
ncbi:MAG: CoA-binding protein [Enhygromyxa sp.]